MKPACDSEDSPMLHDRRDSRGPNNRDVGGDFWGNVAAKLGSRNTRIMARSEAAKSGGDEHGSST